MPPHSRPTIASLTNQLEAARDQNRMCSVLISKLLAAYLDELEYVERRPQYSKHRIDKMQAKLGTFVDLARALNIPTPDKKTGGPVS